MTHVLQTTQTESLPIHSQRETDRGSLLRLVQTHTQIGDSCPTNKTDRKSSYTQSEGDRQTDRGSLLRLVQTHTQIGDSCPTNKTDRKSSYTQSEGDRQTDRQRQPLTSCTDTHTQIGDSCPTNNTDRKSSYTQSERDRQRQPLTSCTDTHADRRLMSYKQDRQKVFLYTVRGRQSDRQTEAASYVLYRHTHR